jgi:hypothetical protein
MKQDQQLQNKPVASTPQAGSNPVLDLMLKNKIPLTRENYLNVAYMGEVPEELSAEEELELPEEFRQQ